MHLRGFKDRRMQSGIVFLQFSQLEFQLLPAWFARHHTRNNLRPRIERTSRCGCMYWLRHAVHPVSSDADAIKTGRLTNKLIASTMNGKNETRLLRVWFQLLPQMNNVRIDRASVWIVFITPYRIEQPIATQRFSWMRDEVRQQSELFRR